MDSKEQGVCVSSQWKSEEPQAQSYDGRGLFVLPDTRRDPRTLQWLLLLKGNHRRLQDTHVQVTELRDHAGMLCMIALPVFCAACFHSNQTAVFLKEEPSGLGAD